MKLKKYAAIAVFAIASMGIAGGTAHADPVAPSKVEVPVANGAQILANFANGAVTLTGAEFKVDGDTLKVTHSGQTHDVPLQYKGNKVEAAAAADGKSATVRPGKNVAAKATDINGAQWFNYELNRAAPGALVGAIVGGIIGIFFFGIGVIPGALLGAAAGLLIAGGQPLIDSGFAYFQGR